MNAGASGGGVAPTSAIVAGPALAVRGRACAVGGGDMSRSSRPRSGSRSSRVSSTPLGLSSGPAPSCEAPWASPSPSDGRSRSPRKSSPSSGTESSEGPRPVMGCSDAEAGASAALPATGLYPARRPSISKVPTSRSPSAELSSSASCCGSSTGVSTARGATAGAGAGDGRSSSRGSRTRVDLHLRQIVSTGGLVSPQIEQVGTCVSRASLSEDCREMGGDSSKFQQFRSTRPEPAGPLSFVPRQDRGNRARMSWV